jgi:phage tail-like protein
MAIARDDPYGAYNFRVELSGLGVDPDSAAGSFSEVSGLGVEIEPIEYRAGTEIGTVRKLPGVKKYSNIVLKRGVTGHVAFWEWLVHAVNGTPQRVDGSIVLLDENRQEVVRWNFRRGWPCKWEGPALGAKNNEVAIETLEICHEGLEIDG